MQWVMLCHKYCIIGEKWLHFHQNGKKIRVRNSFYFCQTCTCWKQVIEGLSPSPVSERGIEIQNI